MSTARDLYREYAYAHKAWEKTYDLPVANPGKRKKANQLSAKEWAKIEGHAYGEMLDAERALYRHMKKNGLKMSAEDFGQTLWDSVDGYSTKHGGAKTAKSKMNSLLTVIGKNEPKKRIKFKLPSQSQLSKYFSRW